MSDISIKEMKKIVYDVVLEELSNSDLKFNIFPITFVEYYNDYIFKGKFSLIRKFSYSLIPIVNRNASGFNDLGGNAVIFLNRVNKVKKVENKIFRLLNICYHELRHSEQQMFDVNSYDKFMNDIEEFIQQFNSNDYRLLHDKYSYEIGANLYCVNKSSEYLKKKYPDLYEKEKEDIIKLQKEYYLDYATYDASDVFDRFLKTIRFKDFRYGVNGDINPILGIFLDEDNNFRRFDRIVNNKKFNSVDKRIVAAIFSSDTFLNEVDLDLLTLNELNILYDSLSYMDTIYKNQVKIINDYELNDEDINKEKCFLEKVKRFEHGMIKKVFSKMSSVRSDEERLGHIFNVSVYKDNIDELIKNRKSRGVLTFNLFVVLFGLILFFVICFLYILN